MGGCGLVTRKLSKTVFEVYAELFRGLKMVIAGGIVPGKGSVAENVIQGLPFAV